MKKAIVLNSGGLDSATCLAIAQEEGYEIHALTFDYGQRHRAEINAAERLSTHFRVKAHRIIQLPIGQMGGSALTDALIDIPEYSQSKEIPVTYVPARNTIFLSIALGLAEVVGAYDIFTGVNAVDYSGYPDCRPEYFKAFQALADLATKTAVEGRPIILRTPLLALAKAQIIQKGLLLGAPYEKSVSCYQADDEGRACRRCDACVLRSIGFQEAGVDDPTSYIF